MTIRELLTKVRDKLQDTDSIYWSNFIMFNSSSKGNKSIGE